MTVAHASLARALAFRAAHALPQSPAPRWAVLGPARGTRWTGGPWRTQDWRAALWGLLGVDPVRPSDGELDLLVVWTPMALDDAERLVVPGRHALVPGTLSAIVGQPAVRRRARWKPHTLLAIDGEHALGWWSRGRWSESPRLIIVDPPDAH